MYPNPNNGGGGGNSKSSKSTPNTSPTSSRKHSNPTSPRNWTLGSSTPSTNDESGRSSRLGISPPLATQVPLLQNKILHLTAILNELRGEMERKKALHACDLRFVRNLLYTLNLRGFVSLKDHHGVVIDLNDCKGDCIFEMQCKSEEEGSLALLPSTPLPQPKPKVKRIWGNEFYYKAIIGNQEKAIQNLTQQLAIQNGRRNASAASINSTTESMEDSDDETDSGGDSSHSRKTSMINSTSTLLDSELLEVMCLLETTCQRCPDVFYALREQHELGESKGESYKPNSPRAISFFESESQPGRTLVEKILDRCKSRIHTARHHNHPCQTQTTDLLGELKTDLESEDATSSIITTSPRAGFSSSNSTLTPIPILVRTNEEESRDRLIGAKATRSFELLDFEKFIGAAVLQLRESGERKHDSAGASSISPNLRSTNAGSKFCTTDEEEMTRGCAGPSQSATTRNMHDCSDSCITIKKKNKNIVVNNKAVSMRMEGMAGFTDTVNNSGSNRQSPRPTGRTTSTSVAGTVVSLDKQNRPGNALLFPIVLPSKRARRPRSDNTGSSIRSSRPISPIRNHAYRDLSQGNATGVTPRSSSVIHIGQVSPRSQTRRPTNSSPLTNSRSKQFFANRLDKKQRCKSSYGGTCYPLTTRDEEIISLPSSTSEDELPTRSGMNCPYCLKEFDKNMSPSDVRKHLEKHVGKR